MVSSSAPRSSEPRPSSAPPRRQAGAGARSPSSGGLRVRHLARGIEDGYHSRLVTGLHSSAEAGRLAEEIAFAADRLVELQHSPSGLYRVVADPSQDIEERSWLAFLIAYLGLLETADPFAEIERVRTPWASGEQPSLDGVETGPRTAHDPARGTRTLDAYRAWAARAGSQAAAFTGESVWTPERRFERVFERLALPGFGRDGRYELLVSLGRLCVYELEGASLKFGGENEATLAAKRALGIGDPLLLDRRATELAHACQVPLESLDLALHNWGTGERVTLGAKAGGDPATLARVQAALGLN